MLAKILGAVALATVGYAIKETCVEQGCPWNNRSSSSDNTKEKQDDEVAKNLTRSTEFHKFKKNIYKTSMREYESFLEKYNIENNDIKFDKKLEKQKFYDEQITDEMESYIKQISNTLEILSHNLSLGISMIQDEKNLEDEILQRLNSYADGIYQLSHLELFDTWQRVNQVEILSLLVKVMGLTTQKDIIHVDLDKK